jgi:hypothetical protein
VVVESGSYRPVPNANLQLIGLGGVPDTIEARAQPDGSFKYDSLLPGRYLLQVGFIGYRGRVDTLVLGPAPALQLTVPLVATPFHVGYWPPDSHVVAAARAQRSKWVCDRDPGSISAAREKWLEFLRLPTVRQDLGLAQTPESDAQLLHRITVRAECQEAAAVYDRDVGVTSLAFTVFRLARLTLISEAWDPEGRIYDEHWHPVGGILLE